MKQQLLRVERPVAEFESLIVAMRHEGERVGWLELCTEPADPLPDSLVAAADTGVLRAVAAGGGRGVAVKPMRGEPVLRDLLREHFRGCRVVLILGETDAPLLTPPRAPIEQAKYWTVKPTDGPTKRWATDKLIAALRKPRPFERAG